MAQSLWLTAIGIEAACQRIADALGALGGPQRSRAALRLSRGGSAMTAIQEETRPESALSDLEGVLVALDIIRFEDALNTYLCP